MITIENRLHDIHRAAAVIKQLAVARIHDPSVPDPEVVEQADCEVEDQAEAILIAIAAINIALGNRAEMAAREALFLPAPDHTTEDNQ